MKHATEKQIAYIKKLKGFVDNGKSNIVDEVDLTKLSVQDASTVIDGLLGLKYENKRLYFGCRLSPMLDSSLDKVYDTLEKYK